MSVNQTRTRRSKYGTETCGFITSYWLNSVRSQFLSILSVLSQTCQPAHTSHTLLTSSGNKQTHFMCSYCCQSSEIHLSALHIWILTLWSILLGKIAVFFFFFFFGRLDEDCLWTAILMSCYRSWLWFRSGLWLSQSNKSGSWCCSFGINRRDVCVLKWEPLIQIHVFCVRQRVSFRRVPLRMESYSLCRCKKHPLAFILPAPCFTVGVRVGFSGFYQHTEHEVQISPQRIGESIIRTVLIHQHALCIAFFFQHFPQAPS